MRNALTVDVEEYFHPSEVQAHVSSAEWTTLPSRVVGQMERILDLFDERSVKATFFVLGWLAEQHPCIVRRIVARGHDVACHSHAHRLIYDLTPKRVSRRYQARCPCHRRRRRHHPSAYRAPSYSYNLEMPMGVGNPGRARLPLRFKHLPHST